MQAIVVIERQRRDRVRRIRPRYRDGRSCSVVEVAGDRHQHVARVIAAAHEHDEQPRVGRRRREHPRRTGERKLGGEPQEIAAKEQGMHINFLLRTYAILTLMGMIEQPRRIYFRL